MSLATSSPVLHLERFELTSLARLFIDTMYGDAQLRAVLDRMAGNHKEAFERGLADALYSALVGTPFPEIPPARLDRFAQFSSPEMVERMHAICVGLCFRELSFSNAVQVIEVLDTIEGMAQFLINHHDVRGRQRNVVTIKQMIHQAWPFG